MSLLLHMFFRLYFMGQNFLANWCNAGLVLPLVLIITNCSFSTISAPRSHQSQTWKLQIVVSFHLWAACNRKFLIFFEKGTKVDTVLVRMQTLHSITDLRRNLKLPEKIINLHRNPILLTVTHGVIIDG